MDDEENQRWLKMMDDILIKDSISYGYDDDYLGPDNFKPTANNVVLTGGGEEMLRVAPDGFYVRGVKVKSGKKEAKAVYEAFKQWMTYAILNGEINN